MIRFTHTHIVSSEEFFCVTPKSRQTTLGSFVVEIGNLILAFQIQARLYYKVCTDAFFSNNILLIVVVEGGLNPFNIYLSVFCLYYLQTFIWRFNSLLIKREQSNNWPAWIDGKGNATIRLNYRSRNKVYTSRNVNIIRPDKIL